MASRLVVLLTLVCGLGVTPAIAQDRAVVFLHGFNSSGATWAQTAARLQERLQIVTATPTTDWRQPYDVQAANLRDQMIGLGAPPSTVAVGHSNGGLIARHLSTLRPLGGIVTVGSPHQGAPLARNIHWIAPFYSGTSQKLGLLLSMLGATGGTNQFTPLWQSVAMTTLRAAISALGVTLYWTTISIEGTLQPILTAPVLTDMTPGSARLAALNAASNTERERIAVPGRVGLVMTARDWWIGAPLVGAAPQFQYRADSYVRSGIQYLEAIAGYFTYPRFAPWDPLAISINLQARSVINDLLKFNSAWCLATTNVPDCSVPTDGVVPAASQYFPGDALNVGDVGPAHVNQTTDAEESIAQALTGRIGLRTRGGGTVPPYSGPPASTLTAGERLYPDGQVLSPNGVYRLLYQTDGNLVLYGPSGPVWASGTVGVVPDHVTMQGDGNFVIYQAGGSPAWATDTLDVPGAELRVEDDGHVAIYDSTGTVVWFAPQP